ncbi:MAG: alginate export family protein [Sphingopyxis granuli]
MVLIGSVTPWSSAAAQGTSAPSAPAVSPASPDPITPYLHARYRLETVDQADIAQSATASTLRLRAGLRTAVWNGLSALVEGEAVVRLGPRDYNDTVNGRTAYPAVPDPTDVLLNQAYVRWQPVRELDVVAGRQTVNLDNQRWVGSVDWRQNDQTLDAVRVGIAPAAGARIDYVHSWRVNRVFGPDSPQGIWRDSNIHLLRGSATVPTAGTLTAYGYWLDLPAAPALSSRTLGVRFAGDHAMDGGVKLYMAGEYAHQRSHGANPRRFGHDYWLIEPGLGVGPVVARVGYERLEGDGTTALQTPLATLHAFNGWTDRFLTTPADGLRDLYGDLQWRLGPVFTDAPATLRLQWHDFNATHGGRNYGREAGAWLTVPVTRRITTSFKLSHYDAQRFASDTTKAWLSIEARY